MKTKIEKRYSDFNVYLLDIWGNEEDGYDKNKRILIGRIRIPAPTFEDVSEEGILRAMKNLEIVDPDGKKFHALPTRNRKIIYIEDPNGTGVWWEIGDTKTRKPIYGIKYVGSHVA